jgi:ribosomal protein S18 acetylase RimI-like enzyme
MAPDLEDSPEAPALTVRRAAPDDARSLAAVFEASAGDAWTFLGPREGPILPASYWDEAVTGYDRPDALLVATEPGHGVAGFTAVRVETGELFLLFVDPARGGRGIGRLLLEAAHDALRAAGCREAFLHTEERNTRALAVYAAAGYVPDGAVRERDFRGTPLRELRLVKTL